MDCSYAALGIRPVINASATLTRLGGSRMPRQVLEAMRAAAEQFVDLVELQQRVGERIAERTHNEACFVSSGAAAGIALAVAACITGTDPKRIAGLPAIDEPRPEVIVHRSQRNGYDHAVRMSGARLVEIGLAHETRAWELESAISTHSVCVVYFAGANFATVFFSSSVRPALTKNCMDSGSSTKIKGTRMMGRPAARNIACQP